jgi:hypothetical protein
MPTENVEDVFKHIDFANGEVRIQSARYQPGWYCLIVLYKHSSDPLIEAWQDVVGGDVEYFCGIEFLRNDTNSIFIEGAKNPKEALEMGLKKAQERVIALQNGTEN